jgi:hypothetical protein
MICCAEAPLVMAVAMAFPQINERINFLSDWLVLFGSRRERFNLLANIVLHLRRAYRQSVQNGQFLVAAR